MTVIDLFAGPGGWDVAARELGMDPIGIEWDDAACATRRAAGLRTVQADVSKLQTHAFLHEHAPKIFGGRKGHEPVAGLIASPPCQAWSTAGRGGGRRDREHVIRCLGDLAAGNDTRAEHAAECEDPRSMLVVEPLRWALDLEPEWIALEQVPPVLELWTIVAQILAVKGYSTWAGVLEAERYGVPQTRERAILLARRDGYVHPPAPTHQRYVPGEPQRHDVTFDGEVLPWVSMRQALSWGAGRVTGNNSIAGGPLATRDGGEPAMTVGSRADLWTYRNGNQENAAERPLDAPAPSVHFGARSNKVDWVPTSTAALQSDDWPETRPATTVAGDSRVFQPGGHHQPGQQSQNAVRVTVQEASILQSFPADYPWQGSRSKQYEQCGNAIPPMLARAVLAVLVEAESLEQAA